MKISAMPRRHWPSKPDILGLLINELVTNAIKYAYPAGSGEIKVSAREIAGHPQVQVSDAGIGLPDGFDLDRPVQLIIPTWHRD
jgi:two-component sensor histidine kinase